MIVFGTTWDGKVRAWEKCPRTFVQVCIVEEDGQSWLNTALLNQMIMRAYNEGDDDHAQRTTIISGPAGQAIQRITKNTVKTHLIAKLWMLVNTSNDNRRCQDYTYVQEGYQSAM